MSLSATAVRRPVGTLTLAVTVLILGVVGVSRLAVDLLPSIDAPRLTITTLYEGVAPQEMETLITRPIEQAVSTLQGVDELTAISSEGLSRVQMTFAWGHNLDVALADVRALLDRVLPLLPKEADPPFVFKFDLADAPIAALGLGGGGDPRRLRYLADEVLSRRLERVPGVASVDVRGGRVREIQVRLKPSRLLALGLDAEDVSATLSRENRNVAAGDMRDAGKEVVIRVEGELESAEEIGGLVLGSAEGRPIYIRDVAEVVDSYQEVKSDLFIDGVPGIHLRLRKQSGTNTVEVVDALLEEVELINRDYEGRLHLAVLFDGSQYIRSAVTNVQGAVLSGGLLAILVLLMFLRAIGPTLVVATAIPTSVLATFTLMDLGGISLNLISLGGLALGVGMLVDGAIVILENIQRRRELGEPSASAAVAGADEVGLAVVAGALTTIAAFVPVVFIEGFAGVFFREMAIVVTFALSCSLVIALTVVPALASLTRDGRAHARPSRLVEGVTRFLNGLESLYGASLAWVLRRKWLSLGGAVLLVVCSLPLVEVVGVELMPETDEGELEIDVELPVGTPVEETMRTMQHLEQRVRGVLLPGELRHVTTSAGPEAFWQPKGSHEGEVELSLIPASERSRSIDAVLDDIRKATADTPGATMRIRKRSSNLLYRFVRGGDDRIRVEIRGHDLLAADALAERVIERIEDIPGVTDANVDREPGKAERALKLDRGRIAEHGLTGAEVTSFVEHYVLGRVPSRLRDGGAEHDIRVRLDEAERTHLEQLAGLPVPLPAGGSVPLGSLVTFEERMSPASIARIDQERVLAVQAGSAGRALGEIVTDIRSALETLEVPEGFAVRIAGEHEKQQEAFSGLLIGVLLAILLVYVVMVVQFESLKQPFIVMAAVPFAGVGALWVLAATGTTFNLNSFLGLIVLVGIVVNNAILLVDAANQLEAHEHLTPVEAVKEAGRRRLRPVLMTTCTTLLGMLPLAVASGDGGEIQAPLARVLVGGLTLSTLVTLVVVPILFVLLARTRPEAPPTPAAGS